MAMNMEIAQFDSTDSWEDRTLRKLNVNFGNIQGEISSIKSTLASSALVGGLEFFTVYSNTNPTVDPTYSSESFSIYLQRTDATFLLVFYKDGTGQADPQTGVINESTSNCEQCQIVRMGNNFTLQNLSAGNKSAVAGDSAYMYRRNAYYDKEARAYIIRRVMLARETGGWIWQNDQNNLIITKIIGVKIPGLVIE